MAAPALNMVQVFETAAISKRKYKKLKLSSGWCTKILVTILSSEGKIQFMRHLLRRLCSLVFRIVKCIIIASVFNNSRSVTEVLECPVNVRCGAFHLEAQFHLKI